MSGLVSGSSDGLILVLNCGSSSIKFALFEAGRRPIERKPLCNGKVDGITGPAPVFSEAGSDAEPRGVIPEEVRLSCDVRHAH